MDAYHYSVYDMRVEKIPPMEDSIGWLQETCEELGLGLRSMAKSWFASPVGGYAYTIVAVLSASHAAIHTSPEASWIEVTFAFCKDVPKGEMAEKITKFFQPKEMKVTGFTGSVPKTDVI
jgi:S-adenosylmethionine/arginine decarboxylase-like enzyme